MNMPFYVAPEQVMKDRADYARKGIARGRALVAVRYADGLAKAYTIRGEDRHVVAVIGDGALTGGMAWEALNNIAVAERSKLVIVVNDNGRSYTPTIGGLATALTRLRTNPRYENVLDMVKRRLNAVPGVGPATYDALHAMKKGLKDALAPNLVLPILSIVNAMLPKAPEGSREERATKAGFHRRGVAASSIMAMGDRAAERHHEVSGLRPDQLH